MINLRVFKKIANRALSIESTNGRRFDYPRQSMRLPISRPTDNPVIDFWRIINIKPYTAVPFFRSIPKLARFTSTKVMIAFHTVFRVWSR